MGLLSSGSAPRHTRSTPPSTPLKSTKRPGGLGLGELGVEANVLIVVEVIDVEVIETVVVRLVRVAVVNVELTVDVCDVCVVVVPVLVVAVLTAR